MSIAVAGFAAAILLLALAGAPFVSGLGIAQTLLIAFALSFSSTVFAVKVLEEKGAMASLAGRIAVGILIVQDLAAVVRRCRGAQRRRPPHPPAVPRDVEAA